MRISHAAKVKAELEMRLRRWSSNCARSPIKAHGSVICEFNTARDVTAIIVLTNFTSYITRVVTSFLSGLPKPLNAGQMRRLGPSRTVLAT